MEIKNNTTKEYFEPVELWLHYTSGKKADISLSLCMTKEQLERAYQDAWKQYKYELEQGIVEFIEEDDEDD
ncbi:MAG: hypothetical protein GXP45_06165 [bacterium]|nr:hypothetical protein [bacterium]